MKTSHIVVGINGGQASIAALEFALDEAELRQTQVLAVICWPAEVRWDDSTPVRCDSHEQAVGILDHVVREATRHDPQHVPIVREVSQSFAGPTLISAARRADLLVLGSTTRGTRARHHGHHTIDYCLHYSPAAVLVVPWTTATFDKCEIEIELHQSTVGQRA